MPKDTRRFVRRYRQGFAERPLWFFSSEPVDASAAERDIPPVPGVKRDMTELDANGHVTFGGCLEEGAKG
jgi:menaquinone-dependent protoporphyrinogen oxidase